MSGNVREGDLSALYQRKTPPFQRNSGATAETAGTYSRYATMQVKSAFCEVFIL